MKKVFVNFLFVLAVIGLVILAPFFFGNSFNSYNRLGRQGVGENWFSRFLTFFLGTYLVLPYLIYLISKGYKKKVLQGEKLALHKMGHNVKSYFEFKAKKGFVEIYVQNQTGDTLIVNRRSLLENEKWHVFKAKKHHSLYFSNGIVFNITEERHVELIDQRNQVIGLGDEYIRKHGIPEYVNHAFILGKPNQGDGSPQE